MEAEWRKRLEAKNRGFARCPPYTSPGTQAVH
jgi:hypothetical protein